jgi:hypothetical protein
VYHFCRSRGGDGGGGGYGMEARTQMDWFQIVYAVDFVCAHIDKKTKTDFLLPKERRIVYLWIRKIVVCSKK